MREGEPFSVQKLSPEIAHVRAETCVLDGVVAPAAVGFVADNRMFSPRQMNANLMCASGPQLNVQQRKTIETPAHPKQRQRAASATHDGHPRAV